MRLTRETIERFPSDGADGLYNLACIRSGFAWFLTGDEKWTAEERAEGKREAALAVETLRKAVAAGFRDLEQLRKDTDLNALRGREDFKALEADLAALDRNADRRRLTNRSGLREEHSRRRRANAARAVRADLTRRSRCGRCRGQS